MEERSIHDLLRALVIPFSDQLDTEKGTNYLLIVRQVLMKSTDMLVVGHPEGEDRARKRIFSPVPALDSKPAGGGTRLATGPVRRHDLQRPGHLRPNR